MAEVNPIGNDRRRSRREKRLGEDAVCVLCGESDPACLTRSSKSLLEAHHVVGRRNDADLKVTVCLNDHRKLTESNAVHGVLMAQPKSVPERIVSILTALGVFFIALGEKCLEWATLLLALVTGLDRELPEWRAVAEAS